MTKGEYEEKLWEIEKWLINNFVDYEYESLVSGLTCKELRSGFDTKQEMLDDFREKFVNTDEQ
jgi:hypothetical protein